jgi:hypothetical protein
MKKLAIAALVAAQLGSAAAPARAAEIVSADPAATHRAGTFAGARLIVPLDGARRAPRATLTAAPTLRSTQPNGESRLRIGRGLEFGFHGEELRFGLAGRPVSRLVQGGDAPHGTRSNVSTVGWVAIGVGVIALTVVGLYVLCGTGEICSTDDD